jgi:hypothetical protein
VAVRKAMKMARLGMTTAFDVDVAVVQDVSGLKAF